MHPAGARERARHPGTRMGPGYRLVAWFFRTLLRVGWQLRVEGLDRLPPRGPFIITANHASEIDPIVLSAAMPFRVTYLAGRELDRYPVLFALIRLFNPIFVRRGAPDVAAVKACLDRLARGEVLVVFPEGGVVQPGMGSLQPGAAFLAIRAQVPVVPVGLLGLARMLPLRARVPRPARVTVRVGDPILPPPDLRLIDDFTASIRRTLAALLGR